LCRNLASKGYEVVVINREEKEAVQLSRQLPVTVLCGDGSDPEILEQAGARSADAILAITPNDQDNLIICQLASLEFSVPRCVALANDPDNAAVFEELGVTAFSTTDIVGSLIEQRASLEQIVNLLPLGEGRVNVTEVILDSHCPVTGRTLKEILMPEGALIGVIIRGERTIIPRGATQLLEGDRVILITLPENHGPALRTFIGEAE
ncbi:MAG: TrkA family potassium uptake protein, partial [Planctomycetia bacterium]|nr:TrkA family potassium uptake protein [Planctomycetia bacterium]